MGAISSSFACSQFCSCECTRLQQSSTSGPQTFQQESLKIHKVQLNSTGSGIWFGGTGRSFKFPLPRPFVLNSGVHPGAIKLSCARTVPKPYLFPVLGIALSEKQIPQAVVNTEK